MRKWIAPIIACVVIISSLSYVFKWPPFGSESKKRSHAAVDANGGSLQSPDESVSITVPKGAAADGTEVNFDTKSPTDEIKYARAVSSIGPAVDVTVLKGELKPKKTDITLAYHPDKLPKGSGPEQVSVAIYQQELGGWITATDGVTVDAKAHTVTLHNAPHYSRYAPVALDAAKSTLVLGGIKLFVPIKPGITVPEWFHDAIKKYGKQLLKDLFGIADPLKCENRSEDFTVETASALNITLEACVNAEKDNGDKPGETVLRLRNGTALPLRGDLPLGMDVNWRRLLDNHDDIGQFLQSVMWMPLGQTTVSNASVSDLVLTDSFASKETYAVTMDEIGWAIDMGIATLSVLQPQVKGMNAIKAQFADDVKAAMANTASKEGLIKGWNDALAKRRAAIKAGETDPALNQFTTSIDFLNCATSAFSNSERSFKEGIDSVGQFKDEGIKIIQSCLTALLGQFDVDQMVKSASSLTKVIPEFIEGYLALIVESFYGISEASATVTRFDKQQELQSYVGTWESHDGVMIINSDGTVSLDYFTQVDCGTQQVVGIACNPDSTVRGGKATFTVDAKPGYAYLVVATSNSPKNYIVGERIPMRFRQPGVIGYGKQALDPDPVIDGTNYYQVCDRQRLLEGVC